MKPINFHCTNCEAKPVINILKVQPFYFVGECSVCKLKIVINRKRLSSQN